MSLPTTIKEPAPHGREDALARYRLGLLDEDGFAATYFKALDNAERCVDTRYSHKHDYNEYFDRDNQDRATESVVETINREFGKIERTVVEALDECVEKNNGVIDMWPDPNGLAVFSTGKESFQFHFFRQPVQDESRRKRRAQKSPVPLQALRHRGRQTGAQSRHHQTGSRRGDRQAQGKGGREEKGVQAVAHFGGVSARGRAACAREHDLLIYASR